MKRAILVFFIIAAVIPAVVSAQPLPQPVQLPTSSLPDIQALTNWIGALGGIVYTHPLTALFVIFAFALFAALPEFVSVSVLLLLLAVAVYLWGH